MESLALEYSCLDLTGLTLVGIVSVRLAVGSYALGCEKNVIVARLLGNVGLDVSAYGAGAGGVAYGIAACLSVRGCRTEGMLCTEVRCYRAGRVVKISILLNEIYALNVYG